MLILRALRDYYHLSQRDLALQLGINQSALSRIEHGDLRPSIQLQEKIHIAIRDLSQRPLPGLRGKNNVEQIQAEK